MKTLIRQLLERGDTEGEDWIRQCLRLPSGQDAEVFGHDIGELPEETVDAIMEEDEEAGPSEAFPLPGRASVSASVREEDLLAKRWRTLKKRFSPSSSPCRSQKKAETAQRSKRQLAQSASVGGAGDEEPAVSRPPVVPPSPRQRAASAANHERGWQGGSPAPRTTEKRTERIAGAASSIPVLCAPQLPARPPAGVSQGETDMFDKFSSALSHFLSDFRNKSLLTQRNPLNSSDPGRSMPVEAAAVVWSDERNVLSAGSLLVPDPVPLAFPAQAAGNLRSG